MFVVPKRNFRKAHDRNKLRRRVKEAYRLYKNTFYKAMNGKPIQLAIIYTSRKPEEYSVISNAVINILLKLQEKA